MRVCPKCGFVDPTIWQKSRSRREIDVCRYDDFLKHYNMELEVRKPIQIGQYAFKLTKAGKWVERICLIDNPNALSQWHLTYERSKNSVPFLSKRKLSKEQRKLFP